VPAPALLGQQAAGDQAGDVCTRRGRGDYGVPGQLTRGPGPAVEQGHAERGAGLVGKESSGLGEGHLRIMPQP
jgi:hypothetical protein